MLENFNDSVPRLQERLNGRKILHFGSLAGWPHTCARVSRELGIPAENWVHMHYIWKKLGFRCGDLRITFAGRSDIKNEYCYDSARHQINANIYVGWEKFSNVLFKNFKKFMPKFLHGYPSAIFDYVLWLSENNHPLYEALHENIEGIFLGSELPNNTLRKKIETLLDCKTISWYGHTERAVLAYEKGVYNQYFPFITYGFSEALEDANNCHLIGTSYFNQASPLIRYNTGDLITPTMADGLLDSFQITQGREGEYIFDADGNKIFLTALIFGRHHQLFSYARHIQISQTVPGKAQVFVVPTSPISPSEAASAFNSENVKLNFEFFILTEPKRTKSGKVPLLITE